MTNKINIKVVNNHFQMSARDETITARTLRDRPLRVYLSDLGYANRLNRHTRHMPKGIGYIASYAKKLFGDDIEIRLFKDPNALLAAVTDQPPDLFGFSFYCWNTSLNHMVTRLLRAQCGQQVPIVWGGPSVDVDASEESRLFFRFPEVDAFVANEGELAFVALLRRMLSKSGDIWNSTIDGVTHKNGEIILKGKDVGLSLDLEDLPSPYLTGLMDPFLTGDYLPGLQTSRLCPYTCSFCVSGKNRGKLRGFLLDQVKEEIDFIGYHFADRPHMTLHINDENFGILARDAEIAEYIVKSREKWGYPKSVFFYHDKRLTETVKHVLKCLAPFSTYGMTIALQTESPEALNVAKRKPVSSAKLSDAIAWAAANNIQTATELIFGLPGETEDSFTDSLDMAIFRGFDSVLCNNLFIVDGIELNRETERNRLGILTRFRQVRENYGMVNGVFCAEVEEVVVATNSFKMREYLRIRKMGIMFYACFNMRFQYWLFSYLKLRGVPISKLMLDIVDPTKAPPGSARAFALDVEEMALGELHYSAEEITQKLKEMYVSNGNDVGEASQLNVLFGARLIYQESEWIDEWVLHNATERLARFDRQDADICRFLINLYRAERVDISRQVVPETMETHWDVLAWRRDKFKRPLQEYPLEKPQRIGFSYKPAFAEKINRFFKDNENNELTDIYVNLFLMIEPKTDLLLDMAYI